MALNRYTRCFSGVQLAEKMETPPLRKLDLEPGGTKPPPSRQRTQNPRDRVERAGGQRAAFATSILWEVAPPSIGVPVPEPPPLFPQGTLTPTTPIHLQPPQDGLNQVAGQTDKLDAKVGVRPEASRGPGQEPQGSPGTNGHMEGHTSQGTWP